MVIHLPQYFEGLIRDICDITPDLQHIDAEKVLVLVDRMSARRCGENMGLRHARRGKVYEPIYPTVYVGGRDIRYVIRLNPHICLPGFFEDSDPLETVMHELWHIGTKCDGTMRRMSHGKKYNAIVKGFVDQYKKFGGGELPVCLEDTEIMTRKWKSRQKPSIAYIRRDIINREKHLNIIDWKDYWSDDDIKEEQRVVRDLLPKTHIYQCAKGHELKSHIKFKKPRSCAECSDRYNSRFKLEYIEILTK